jgi:hypothetical protein
MAAKNSVPLFAVYGSYNRGPHLYEEPVVRPLGGGDITELAGRYIRMTSNHNGQRLQSWDVHDEVCAAFEQRDKAAERVDYKLAAISADLKDIRAYLEGVS